MIIEKRIIAHGGKISADSSEISLTYGVFSDNWRDGPVAIASQGQSDRIMDETGKVLGWLPRGHHYEFGNEIDMLLVASEVEVSDRKIIDADDEFAVKLYNNNVDFVRETNRRAIVQWTVKQNFKKRSLENDEPGDEPSESDTFTLKYSKEFIDVPFVRDVRTGRLIVNSAGDPFIPTPVRRKALRIFSLTRKERKHRVKFYEQYEDVVNEDEWYGARPGTVLMESIIPDWDGTIFTVTYNFKYKADGWGEKYLDTGFRELKIKKIKKSDGSESTIKQHVQIKSPGTMTPVEEPVKLDGEGRFPIRRQEKNEEQKFYDVAGNPVLDPETGEQLCREFGEPVYIIDSDQNKHTIPYNNFPGIDMPYDPPNTPEDKRRYFWRHKALSFAELKIPNPYTVKPSPKPTVEEEHA